MIFDIEVSALWEDSIINGGIPAVRRSRGQRRKNSALPLLAACLLTEEEVVLHNRPRIGDVFSMQGILEKLGAHVRFSGNTICVAAKEIETVAMPEKLSKNPLLHLPFGFHVGPDAPGGVPIPRRMRDRCTAHRPAFGRALRKLGVEIEEELDTIHCRTEALRGARISAFPIPAWGRRKTPSWRHAGRGDDDD